MPETHRKLRITFLFLTKKGLGISSLSGSQVAGGSSWATVVVAATGADEVVAGILLSPGRLSSSRERPPARAWASSTRDLPPMLRCIMALNISSPPGLVPAFAGGGIMAVFRDGEPSRARLL